jgi:predicted ATPase
LTAQSALYRAAFLAHPEGNFAEVENCASNLIELSTHHDFATWLPHPGVLRGWARSASGDTVEGISWIEDGLKDTRATGVMLTVPFVLALKAEALHLADRTVEALEAIREADAVVERSENRYWSAELHRLRGVFLAAMGAEEPKSKLHFTRIPTTSLVTAYSGSLGNQPQDNISGVAMTGAYSGPCGRSLGIRLRR